MARTTVSAAARTSVALAAAAVALSAAACSSSGDDSSAPEASPATAATAAQPSPGAAQPTGSAQPAEGAATPAPGQGAGGQAQVLSLKLNGQALDTGFPNVRCDHEHDEGHPQIDLEAQDRAADTELEVEIVLSDPPKLDDFQWEQGNDEWEATKSDRGQAQIGIEGTHFTVSGPVTHDDTGEAGTLEAEFTCP